MANQHIFKKYWIVDAPNKDNDYDVCIVDPNEKDFKSFMSIRTDRYTRVLELKDRKWNEFARIELENMQPTYVDVRDEVARCLASEWLKMCYNKTLGKNVNRMKVGEKTFIWHKEADVLKLCDEQSPRDTLANVVNTDVGFSLSFFAEREVSFHKLCIVAIVIMAFKKSQ